MAEFTTFGDSRTWRLVGSRRARPGGSSKAWLLRGGAEVVKTPRHLVLVAALLLMFICGTTSEATAQVALSNEQALEVERLGEKGVGAFQSGAYAAALGPLEEGYELSKWGTIGVWLAKTLEKLDRPLDAYRVYSEVAAGQARPEDSAPFVRAREEAGDAVARLEAVYAIVQLRGVSLEHGVSSEHGVSELGVEVVIDGQVRRLSTMHSLAVKPGEVNIEVRWQGGRLPPKSYHLEAGQHLKLELTEASEQASPQAPPVGAQEEFRVLDFGMVGVEGWTLHDARGDVVCELPCKWSSTDPESLSVRKGDLRLPVRLGRKLAKSPHLAVTVNPQRGSKAWALGLGIPAGILFGASLLAAANPEAEYPAAAATGAVVFGAGFGMCAWWFIWSKSRPYLDYEVTPLPSEEPQATVGLDFYGNGLGLSGTF